MTQVPLSVQDLRRVLAQPVIDAAQTNALLTALTIPREIWCDETSLTITEDHRCAVIIFTSNSPITVTLPALEGAFQFNFLQYGEGTITFSGETLGGSVSAGQYTVGLAWLMSTGEWLMSGATSG